MTSISKSLALTNHSIILASQLKPIEEEIKLRSYAMAKNAVETGLLLLEAKEKVRNYIQGTTGKNGCYRQELFKWAEEKLDINSNAAAKLMRIAEVFRDVDVGNLSIAALHELAEAPEELRNNIIEKSLQGETFSAKRIKTTVYESRRIRSYDDDEAIDVVTKEDYIYEDDDEEDYIEVDVIKTPRMELPSSTKTKIIVPNLQSEDLALFEFSDAERKLIETYTNSNQAILINTNLHNRVRLWAKKYRVYISLERNEGFDSWANPFVCPGDGDEKEIVTKYRKYLEMRPSLLSRIDELRGKVLGCGFNPQLPFHGYVLLDIANGS